LRCRKSADRFRSRSPKRRSIPCWRRRPSPTLSAIATGSSSSQVGFQRIFPAAALRAAYDTSSVFQVSTDFGTRFIARHSVSQSYGDVSVNQRLRKNLTFAVGAGTAFNPVSNEKAHYLASGFSFRIR